MLDLILVLLGVLLVLAIVHYAMSLIPLEPAPRNLIWLVIVVIVILWLLTHFGLLARL